MYVSRNMAPTPPPPLRRTRMQREREVLRGPQYCTVEELLIFGYHIMVSYHHGIIQVSYHIIFFERKDERIEYK